MNVRFVKLLDPCERCGGRLAELAAALFRAPRCHYCGSLAKVPLRFRIEAWTDTLKQLLSRDTGFHPTGAQEQVPKSVTDQLRAAMGDVSRLYVQGARDVLQTTTPEVTGDEKEWVESSSVLGRALLIKLLAGALPAADCPPPLADLVMQELTREPWSREGRGHELGRLVALAPDLDLRMALQPFRRLPSFRRRTAELVTHATRIVNLVIKFDGVVTQEELERQRVLLSELKDHIAQFPRLPPPTHQEHPDRSIFDQLREDARWLRRQLGSLSPASVKEPGESPLRAALRDLDALVGIEPVKQDVRGLVDVLELRAERRRLGLPDADLRFHVAFLGNEGTGQGTVAAILGRISAALGALTRGHLVETSGEALAANEASIDERFDTARDGVLLVHHASRLKSGAQGRADTDEVWNRLLQRADANRDRLVLVLSDQAPLLEALLDAKIGLSQRFRRLRFNDYSAVELGRVLERMARENRYRISRRARLQLLNALNYVVQQNGAMPGNARALRDLFERAVELQAQRLARAPGISSAALTLMDAEDFVVEGVPDEVRNASPAGIRTECPRCGRAGRFPSGLLGGRIHCRACQHEMFADWGIPSDA